MLETSARLLRLLSLLQTPREWSGPELAERLQVTTRTVRNDIDRLRRLGYPVDAIRGAVGGYRLGAGSSLPPLLLDDEEAVAVTVGLRTATAGAIEGIEESSLGALAKLEKVLPPRLRRRVGALSGFTVAVPARGGQPTVSPETLTTIAAACRDRERLRFDYLTRGAEEPTRREAEPYRLVNWGRRWYLIAWDVAREDWRTFRVDRLTLKVPNGPRFDARPLPDEDVAGYVSRGVASASRRVRARVVVNAPAEELTARLPASVGVVEPLDAGRSLLHTGADTAEQLVSWIGVLGADFEVLDAEPEIVEQLRGMRDRYTRALAAATERADFPEPEE
ncbi:WYL domain-containing protein [Streptomyces sp. 3MP-14]|uniref:WYL domain-containing protein n=1 Tax=Streptomyces mimosae TaxID=2586635 RepID=A0A5N6A8J1_9ACTN|nr:MULTISPECIES: WYL domain-containing protein [Streptomyces]KAB8163788.1 WYL domain-containing protein [Streptomyces mimosae]KAB8175231.1 WYL domain-containing protein [Streptomyces sp. 3MP-14]